MPPSNLSRTPHFVKTSCEQFFPGNLSVCHCLSSLLFGARLSASVYLSLAFIANALTSSKRTAVSLFLLLSRFFSLFFSWYKGNHVCDILTILFCSKLWNCMLDYVICCFYPTQLCITVFSFWLTGFHTRTDLYCAGICSGWCWVTVPDNSNKKLHVGCWLSSSFQALQLFPFILV